jgi:CRP/FNR family transcriptional regulator
MCREIDGGVCVLLLFYRIQIKYKLTGRRKFMSIDVEVLRRIPLFKQLGQEDLAQVALMTQERRYERGDLILLEGDLGGALHYVHAGLVKVFKTSPSGKEQVLSLIAPGHTFNDVPALDGGPNPASAAALEQSVIYVIRRADLRELIRMRPEVAEAVVRTLTGALRHLVALVEDLSLRHVTARVAKILLDQEKTAAQAQNVYHLTQQEMAALAGTAREVVGRSLKELEGAGAIEMRQGRAIVMNRERLQLLASE